MASMPIGDRDLPNMVITLVLVFTILFIGAYIGNSVIATTSTQERLDATVGLDPTPGVNNWQTIDDHVGRNEKVYNSLGIAVELAGTDDSYVKSQQNVTLASDDTWSVGIWAGTDNASATQTALSVGDRLVITHNASATEWRAWYYEDGSANSYTVNVSAPDQPNTLAYVLVVRDGSSLTIYRNATPGETETLSGTNSAPAPVEAGTWNGRLDELRAYDTALNSTLRNATYDNPVAPRPEANRTARAMFDERGKTTQLLFFADGGLTTSNVTFSDGLDGEVLEKKNLENDLAGTSDYVWRQLGPQIKATDGGQLDAAPVVYVRYGNTGIMAGYVADWMAALRLAGVLAILLPLGVIFVYLERARSR